MHVINVGKNIFLPSVANAMFSSLAHVCTFTLHGKNNIRQGISDVTKYYTVLNVREMDKNSCAIF